MSQLTPCLPPAAESSFDTSFEHVALNPQSIFWKECTIRHCGFTTADQVAAYFRGMGGYLFSLIWRLGGLVKDFFMFLGALFCGDAKGRGIALLGSLGEVGVALVGTFCPPIAYRLDERIQKDPDIQKYSVICQEVASNQSVVHSTWQTGVPREPQSTAKPI